MRRIREGYITGTSCTLVLCGKETASRKYVDWEIKATLDAGHSLIGIALEPPGSNYLKPDRLFDNLMTRYAGLVDWLKVVWGSGDDSKGDRCSSAEVEGLDRQFAPDEGSQRVNPTGISVYFRWWLQSPERDVLQPSKSDKSATGQVGVASSS